MKTILIALPYAVSIRDFVNSRVLDILRAVPGLRLVVLTKADEIRYMESLYASYDVCFESLVDCQLSRTEVAWYRFLRALLYKKSRTIQLGNTAAASDYVWLFRIPAALARVIGGESRALGLVRKAFLRHARPGPYRVLFEKYCPDLVVCTRVVGFSQDYWVLKEAAAAGIASVVLASSWDNLTSKAWLPLPVRSVVLWNEVMKDEMIDLFHARPQALFVAGVPRWDIWFARPKLASRESFLCSLGLDPSLPLVTYGTGSADTSVTRVFPRSIEPHIARFLALAVERGELGRCQLLVRLHPQARERDYADIQAIPGVAVVAPGRPSGFSDRAFSRDDDLALLETMHHSTVVVNLASTLTLDAIACDTPVVCVAFDYPECRPYSQSVRRFYEFDHYRKLADTKCFRFAWSPSSLLNEVSTYLDDPARDAAQRALALRTYAGHLDGLSGSRVAHHILELLDEDGSAGDVWNEKASPRSTYARPA